eukprot:3159184-Prymnesium_polylepis.1
MCIRDSPCAGEFEQARPQRGLDRRVRPARERCIRMPHALGRLQLVSRQCVGRVATGESPH